MALCGGRGGRLRGVSDPEWHTDPLPASEEDRQPAIPPEQSVNRLASLPYDLGRESHHRVEKRPELQALVCFVLKYLL